MDTQTQLKDHEKRIRVLDAFMQGEIERHNSITATFERIEADLSSAALSIQTSSEKMIEAIEKRFASKNDLELLKNSLESDLKFQASEGKWKSRFVGAISSVATAVILMAIGALLNLKS